MPGDPDINAFADFMTDTTFNLRDYQIPRWRKLAEQRLEHVTDLFVTGRWRRYFSEKDFLELVRQSRDAAAASKIWCSCWWPAMSSVRGG